MESNTHAIAGYTYGEKEIKQSPVSLPELKQLIDTVALTDEDFHYLHLAGNILETKTEDIINVWRSVIGSHEHLAYYFKAPNGKPDENYKARAKERFKQWIVDVCRRRYDQDWLNYQYEIGLRHTHAKKNSVDNASTAPHIPLRYVIAFTAVINNTIKPFLSAGEEDIKKVEKMYEAWTKAVMLHVTLWSRAYVAETDW
jgi:hypothetical protein